MSKTINTFSNISFVNFFIDQIDSIFENQLTKDTFKEQNYFLTKKTKMIIIKDTFKS